MGRRARTNCSPVDNVIEKYHQEIGHRLSGVFIPPSHPSPDNNEDVSTCEAFSMLTLDFRGHGGFKSNKNQTVLSEIHPLLNKDIVKPTFDGEMDSQRDDSAFDHAPTRSDTISSFSSQSDSISVKEKRNIMDKLARAIFQRKHTCARCQRKSRSCLQNKTSFNINEKHYTCARCRETSRAIKNLVSGQDLASTLNDTTKNNADIILNKPRVHLKDSGYETVTSCSTVESAPSNSNSPYTSSRKHAHTNHSATMAGVSSATPCSRVAGTDDLAEIIGKDIITATPYSNRPMSGHQEHDALCYSSNPTSTPSSPPHANTNIDHTGLEHYLGVAGEDGVRVLKQVKTRYVHNYDGYLPDQELVPHTCDVILQSGRVTTDNNSPQSHHQQSSDSQENRACNGRNNNPHDRRSPIVCHICSTSSRPCFRLPWEGGWLCEDCIDGML